MVLEFQGLGWKKKKKKKTYVSLKSYDRKKSLNMCQFAEFFPKQALVFTCMQYKFLENTMGKGEIARNEQF